MGPDPRLVAWLAENGPRSRRVCSVCVGAFLLAEAGLLAGRSATTHWGFIETLKRKCDGATILDGPIFVHDGNIWSSAGVSAGIDLALHLVEDDHGRKLAMDVAKMLVGIVKLTSAKQTRDARHVHCSCASDLRP